MRRAPRGLVFLLLALVACVYATDRTAATAICNHWGLEASWGGSCDCPEQCERADGMAWTNNVTVLNDFACIAPGCVITRNKNTWPQELFGLMNLYALIIRGQTNLACPPMNVKLLNGSLGYLDFGETSFSPTCNPFPSWPELTLLKGLDLDNCQLHGPWPSWLNGLTAFRELYIDGNHFDNAFSLTLSNSLSIMKEVWLSRWFSDTKERTSFVQFTDNMNSLEVYSAYMMWNGSFVCPNNLPLLRRFDIQQCDFAGLVTPACVIRPICHLEVYNIAYTYMKGAFPSGLGLCPNLTGVYLSGTDLQNSSAPDAVIANLTKLQDLHIEDSLNFISTLPPSIGKLPLLQSIWINFNNEFTGQLPTMMDSPYLKSIDLQYTGLTGTLPQGWAFNTKLASLNIAGTPLLGSLPGWLLTMPSASEVFLKATQFTNCTLPSSVARHTINSPNTTINGIVFWIDRPLVLCEPCPQPAPINGSVCFNDQWYFKGPIVVPTVNITRPVRIDGNLTQPAGAVIVVNVGNNFTDPFISVNGTATVGGSIEIVISNSSAIPGGNITVIEATQIVGKFTTVSIAQTGPNGCAYTAEQTNSGSTLTVLFYISPSCTNPSADTSSSSGPTHNKKDDHTTAIIAGATAGGVVLVAVAIVVVLVAMKKVGGHWLWQAREDENVVIEM